MKDSTIQHGYATYLRVSSEAGQSPESSFDDQLQRIEYYIAEHYPNLPRLHEYIDIGSGRTSSRPAYQCMLADAREGQFSHLVICSMDRLGRTMKKTLAVMQELQSLGVELIVVDSQEVALSTLSGQSIA